MVARCYERYVYLFLKDVTIIACMPSKALCFLVRSTELLLRVGSVECWHPVCVCVCVLTHTNTPSAVQFVPLTWFSSWGAGKPWKTVFVLLGLILQMLAHRRPVLFQDTIHQTGHKICSYLPLETCLHVPSDGHGMLQAYLIICCLSSQVTTHYFCILISAICRWVTWTFKILNPS